MSGIAALVLPLLRQLDPERAHRLTIRALAAGLVRGDDDKTADARLAIEVLGLRFANPLGLAAGFDKDAEVADAMLRLGFGFVEVGSITPRPQAGNPRPRLFRLPEDGAVINRLGFNSRGVAAAAARLAARRRGAAGIVGANLGANRDSGDRIADYVEGLRRLGALVDYVTVNISSPNTPGLRALQGRRELEELLTRLLPERDRLPRRIPLLVKIAPDLSPAELEAVAEVGLTHGLDGLVIGNTTTGHRDRLRSRHRNESGGLSGRPLLQPSTAALATMRRLTAGRLVLVGVGGIASGGDAYDKIRAGASLVQLYTALTYQGPGLVRRIRHDLSARLAADGFRTVAEAVGTFTTA